MAWKAAAPVPSVNEAPAGSSAAPVTVRPNGFEATDVSGYCFDASVAVDLMPAPTRAW